MSDMDVVMSAADVAAAVADDMPDVLPDASATPMNFPAVSVREMGGKAEQRKVPVPPHRMTPLKENWMKIYQPVVEFMHLQIRMNLASKSVEIRTSEFTEDVGAVQRAADFVHAFMLGFEVDDAVAMLRLDGLYVDSFDITDIKMLHGDHLSRAIGRVAGQDGKTRYTIENVTKTRIVLADSKVHILGSYQNIRIARDAISDLVLGSPPGKVYSKLRTVASRMAQRF